MRQKLFAHVLPDLENVHSSAKFAIENKSMKMKFI